MSHRYEKVPRTCRCKLKFNQALRRDDHPLESIWAELRGSVAAYGEVGAKEEFLGHYGMEFRIVIAESQRSFAIVMNVDVAVE